MKSEQKILLDACSRPRHLFLDSIVSFFSTFKALKGDNQTRKMFEFLGKFSLFLDSGISDAVISIDELANHFKFLSSDDLKCYLSLLKKYGFYKLQGRKIRVIDRQLASYLDSFRHFVGEFLSLAFNLGDSFEDISQVERVFSRADSFFEFLSHVTYRSWRKIISQLSVLNMLVSDENENSSIINDRIDCNRKTAWESWLKLRKILQEDLQHQGMVTKNVVGLPSKRKIPVISKRDFFHPFFDRLGVLTELLECSCPRHHARSKCYRVYSSRVLKLSSLLARYFLIFDLLNLLKETNSYIPRYFWKKIIKYGVDAARYDFDALVKAYQNSASSTHWLIIILPKTLVGDDAKSLEALKPMISNPRGFLTSLIYKVPITDRRDDEIIRMINRAGGELHVPLTEGIDFPPIAISDNEKLTFTAMSDVEDIFPVIYVETTNPNFVNEVVANFIELFNRYPQYEMAHPYLKALYEWYHHKREVLDRECISFLQKHCLLDEEGKISKLGEIIVRSRLY